MTDSPIDVLIVEDQALLAMDIEMIVEDAGHRVVGEAACVGQVETLIATLPHAPHLALVDVQLAKDTSGIDAARLIRRRWPDTIVVFVTANPAKLGAEIRGDTFGVIAKPFSRSGMALAIAHVVATLHDPSSRAAVPASFEPFRISAA